jgi:hypothetical protein
MKPLLLLAIIALFAVSCRAYDADARANVRFREPHEHYKPVKGGGWCPMNKHIII